MIDDNCNVHHNCLNGSIKHTCPYKESVTSGHQVAMNEGQSECAESEVANALTEEPSSPMQNALLITAQRTIAIGREFTLA